MRFGIDLGGTKTEIIAIDEHGKEVHRKRIPSPQGNYQATLDTLTNLVLATEQHLQTQANVGIGIPGSVSPDTGKVKNANSTWLIGEALQADLEKSLQRPIRIANDADCFALSEASDGAGSGYKTVFGVILGTGVGGGIVANGNLLSGPNAIAGEWGHNSLPWADKGKDPQLQCYCGLQGCIETYLSGPGFTKHFQLAGGDEHLNPPDIIQEIENNPLAKQSYDLYIDRLARSLASVINIVDPHAIVLGGGMSNIETLYQDVPKVWQQYVFSDQINTTLLKAKYGDSSGVRGAAWLWPA